MASNSRHLKRHSMPVSWPIKRKNINFITRPNPGSHKRDYAVALVVILRDVLGHATTTKEAKLIAHTSEIFVNGKQVKDIKTPVGIFDIVEIKKTSEKYIVLFDELGKIKLTPSKDNLIYLKVSGKTQLPGKKLQLNFMNGFNVLVDEKVFKSTSVNDTVVYDFAKKKISSVLNLAEKAYAYIFDGNFKGKFAEITGFTHYKGVTRDTVFIKIGKEAHSTAKDYCYVVGNKAEDIKRFA